MNRKNWLSALLAVMMVISMMACIALPAVAVSDITQTEAEALPLASTATKTDEHTKYQINSIDELLRTSHIAPTTAPTANTSSNFATGDIIYITADLDLSTWDPSNFATYDEGTGKYTTKGGFVANKGTLGSASSYLKYSATAEGVECDTKEEVFATLWNGFNARAALYSTFYASIDGLGHTIRNLYTYNSFLSGQSGKTTIKNLTFENCVVDNTNRKSGWWTGKACAIVAHGVGDISGAYLNMDNVHLIECSINADATDGTYIGAFLDFSSNGTRPVSMVNCSMVGCDLNVTGTVNTTVGLLMGSFRTNATLTLENVLVADSTLTVPNRMNSRGLVIGSIYNTNSAKIEANNVAVINCGEVMTTAGTAPREIGAVVSIVTLDSTSSADNFYFANNTLTYTTKTEVEGSGTQMVDPGTGEPMVDAETGEPVIDPDTIQYTEETVVAPITSAIVDTAGKATAAAAVVGGTYVTETPAGDETVYGIKNLASGGTSTEIPVENQVATLDLAATVAAMNETSKGGLWRVDGAGNPVLAAGYALNISFIVTDSDTNEYITHSFYTDLVTGKLAYNSDFTAVDPDELDDIFAAADKTGMIPAGSTDAADVISVGEGNWSVLKDKVYDSSVSYEEIPYASRVYVNDGIKLYQINSIQELVDAASFEDIVANGPKVTDKNGLTNDHTGWIVLDDATCTSTSGGDTYKSTTYDVKDLSTYATFVITDDLDVNDYTSEYWNAVSYTTADWDAEHAATDAQKAFRTDYRGFMPATDVGSSVNSGYFGAPVVIDGLGHTISNFYDGDPFISGYFSGAVKNLTFDNACVVTNTAAAGVTRGNVHAILTRGGDAESINEFRNVHIRDSYLGVLTGTGYIGAFTAYGGANKATHYWTVYENCSVSNTTIYAPNATKYISLFAGQSGGAAFEMYNCLAIGNTIHAGGTLSTTDGTPTIIANANHNNIKTLNFENIAAINNTFVGTETESPVSILAQWNSAGTPAVKVDNIYAVNNNRKVGEEGEATPITLLIADRFNEFKLSNKKLNFTNVGGTSAGVTMIKHTTNEGYYNEADEIANTLPLVTTEAEAIAKLNDNGQNFADWYKNDAGDYVLAYAYNESTETIYEYTPWAAENHSLDKVLSEVGSGDVIKLGIDFTAGDLVVEDYTLDLCGNTLTTTSLFADSDVIDSSNGRGLLKGTVELAAGNAQLALNDADAAGYRLYDFESKAVGYQANVEEETVKYGFRLNFTNADAYRALAAAVEAGTATYSITLNADALDAPITYQFDALLINAYADYLEAGRTPAFTLNVDGLGTLTATDTVTAVATVASAGVSGASAVNAYEWVVL